MAIKLINPPRLYKPETHSHVGIATGNRIIYLAGQVARDAEGNIVGVGDLAAQTEQVLVNVAIALEAAGASFKDVAKIIIYVVDWKPERMGALVDGMRRVAARLRIGALSPTTLVGVASLFHPDILVEFDVTAVVDGPS